MSVGFLQMEPAGLRGERWVRLRADDEAASDLGHGRQRCGHASSEVFVGTASARGSSHVRSGDAPGCS